MGPRRSRRRTPALPGARGPAPTPAPVGARGPLLAAPPPPPAPGSAEPPPPAPPPLQRDRGWHGQPTQLPKVPVMTGSGGAVSSVDRDASQVGIDVLARGGNAADAAVATAAALGVTEPYSAGIGGGGLLLFYHPRGPKGSTHHGRRTGPGTLP